MGTFVLEPPPRLLRGPPLPGILHDHPSRGELAPLYPIMQMFAGARARTNLGESQYRFLTRGRGIVGPQEDGPLDTGLLRQCETIESEAGRTGRDQPYPNDETVHVWLQFGLVKGWRGLATR